MCIDFFRPLENEYWEEIISVERTTIFLCSTDIFPPMELILLLRVSAKRELIKWVNKLSFPLFYGLKCSILLQFCLKMTFDFFLLFCQCGNCNIFNRTNIQIAYSFKWMPCVDL